MTTQSNTDAIRFLTALDPEATAWTFQTFDDSDRKDSNLARILHGSLVEHAAELERLNSAGAGVFVTINKTNLIGRRAENITRVRACFADFDVADPSTPDRLRAFALPPSLIVESSPRKYHAYWLVSDLALNQFKDLQKQIIYAWSTDDKVHDLPRVMRLPGFFHRKGEPFQTSIVEVSERLYTAAELLAGFPVIAETPLTTPQAPHVCQPDVYAQAALERAVGAVSCAAEGTRNDELNRQAFGLFGFVKAGRLRESGVRDALHRAGALVGLVDTEVTATLRSAWEAAPPRYEGIPVTRSLVIYSDSEAEFPATEPPPPRFTLLNRDALRRLPDMDWRIDHVLPRTGIGLIIGQSGAGKSFAAIDLLARVSLGQNWFGHDTRPCKAVYCALEGRAGIKRRIEAWERHYGHEMPDNFAVVLDSLKLTEGDDVHELAHAILEAGGEGGLIVIDTLAQAGPGIDENSSADMGLLIEALQRLQGLTDGMVLAVHHMGKDTSRGARGHSSLYAACDAVLAVSASPQTISTDNANGGKSKDAEPVTHGFDLESVTLHITDDGQEIAGAVLVERNSTPKASLPKEPKGGNVKIVWDKLGAMLREAGDIRPSDAPDALPVGRPTVRLDAVIEQIGPQLPVDAKRQTERTNSAITSLINSGHITHMSGWIWCK